MFRRKTLFTSFPWLAFLASFAFLPYSYGQTPDENSNENSSKNQSRNQSAEATVRASLDLISKLDDKYNAIVALDQTAALAAAYALDQMSRAAGRARQALAQICSTGV